MTRLLLRLLGVLLLLLAAATGLVAALVWGSVPRLDGQRTLNGVLAEVRIERDSLGVVNIQAASRRDAMFALGFVHAQERFFEMDLARRQAAGELAALFGPRALDSDLRLRPHQFRLLAVKALRELTPARRELLEVYAAGVAAGLADLPVRPWAYLLLGEQPARWVPEDSILVLLSMFIGLDDAGGKRELALGRMHELLPAPVYAFINRPGSAWDTPLMGAVLPDPPLPGPEVLDLRSLDRRLFLDPIAPPRSVAEGSNQFAVSGALAGGGPALVANDMHLGLRVPNIWFRAQWEYPESTLPEGRRRMAGLTLPGMPGMVVGSNGQLAWGFTNAYGDWMDWVVLEPVAEVPGAYQHAEGQGQLQLSDARIEVAGAAAQTLKLKTSGFGPVLAQDAQGRELALSWSVQQPGALGLALMDLETSGTLEAALDLASASGTPPVNLVVGDQSGRIGWTLSGPIPRRICPREADCSGGAAGFDWQLPISSLRLPDRLHEGLVDSAAVPKLVDPVDGRLWTANARVVDGVTLQMFGDGGYDLGARARQIRDGLLAREQFTEADLLAIQLDDRALLLEPWQQLLGQVLAAHEQRFEALRSQLAGWDGHASADSVAYRVVRAFRLEVHRRVMGALAAPVRAADPGFAWPRLAQSEGTVWQLLQARPVHLLDPNYADWDALLLSCVEKVELDLGSQPGGLAARRWGELNTSAIRHPLSRALPGLFSRWLDMPASALPGDAHMPRVQAPGFGASQRMVVGPGQEQRGILHMPGGQSGHPWSPFYGAGHRDWEHGFASPLLAGAATHSLLLQPATAAEGE